MQCAAVLTNRWQHQPQNTIVSRQHPMETLALEYNSQPPEPDGNMSPGILQLAASTRWQHQPQNTIVSRQHPMATLALEYYSQQPAPDSNISLRILQLAASTRWQHKQLIAINFSYFLGDFSEGSTEPHDAVRGSTEPHDTVSGLISIYIGHINDTHTFDALMIEIHY